MENSTIYTILLSIGLGYYFFIPFHSLFNSTEPWFMQTCRKNSFTIFSFGYYLFSGSMPLRFTQNKRHPTEILPKLTTNL